MAPADPPPMDRPAIWAMALLALSVAFAGLSVFLLAVY